MSARRTGLFLWIAAVLCGLAFVAHADLRTLEAVGTVPISRSDGGAVIPREAAIDAALREAVTRVAQEFLADRVIDETSDENVDAALIDEPRAGAGPEDPAAEDERSELERVLGEKMVPYTTRFRMIEDRGRRPALFAEDPDVREEYVVIVEVQVDAQRVRSRLVEFGLIPAGEGSRYANEVLIEVEGLTRYRAYVDFRTLLTETLKARGVVPLELSRSRAVLDVETETSAVEFLETLLMVAPANMEIEPLHASGSRLHLVVEWSPPASTGQDD